MLTPVAIHRLAAPLALAAVPPGGYSLRERYFVPGFGPRECLPFR